MTDDTGNKHDGHILGSPSCVDGKINKAFEFSGENKDRIIVNKDIKLDNPEYTITSWFYIDEFKAPWEEIILRMKNSTSTFEDAWNLVGSSSGELYFWFTDSSQKNVNHCCIEKGKWNFVSVYVSKVGFLMERKSV